MSRRRMLPRFARALTVLAGMAVASPSIARLGPEPDALYIFGGREAQDCEWPNVGRLGGCTATLVHEDLIVFAAHCGTQHKWVRFDGGRRRVKLSHCAANPDYSENTLGEGLDWAYCTLEDSSWTKGIPLVPPLRRGELQQIKSGPLPYAATLVGYGKNDIGASAGSLVEVDTWVVELDKEARAGGDGADSCQGDSGGPLFVQMKDSSWRLLGITSYGGACGRGGNYSLLAKAAPWIEAQSGRRIANCDADPGGCGALLSDPGGNYGRHAGQCLPGPTVQPNRPVAMEWMSPGPSERIADGRGLRASLAVQRPQAWAQSRLRVELDGRLLGEYRAIESSLELEIPQLAPGQHVLRALLIDPQGEAQVAARRAFRWKLPAKNSKGEELSSPSDLEVPAVKLNEETEGCSVGAASSKGLAWMLVALLGLRRSRRRTERPSC